MAVQLQLRRGTTEENDQFLGAEGEITLDTTIWALRVHDDVTLGGHEVAKSDLSNVLIRKSLTPLQNLEIDVGTPTNKWRSLYLSNSIHIAETTISQNNGVKFSTPSGNFYINQSLANTDSPTFNNLTVTGTIFGYKTGSPFSVVNDESERNALALDERNRLVGMLALTTDSNKLWQMKSDFQTWQEYIPRPTKQTFQYQIPSIVSSEYVDFELDIGNSVVVYKVEVSHVCMLEVFDTPERNQDNPYKFISTEDHLIDDGSSLLSDGTVLRGRRYHIWSSFTDNNKIYCRVTNISSDDITSFNLSIVYSVLEYSLAV